MNKCIDCKEANIEGKRRCRECFKKNLSIIYKGKNNPAWKGDNVGRSALHRYIEKRLKKPDKCIKCKKETKKLDLTNISQKYKRSLSDWRWLCRGCHLSYDYYLMVGPPKFIARNLIKEIKFWRYHRIRSFLNHADGKYEYFKIVNEILIKGQIRKTIKGLTLNFG